LKNGEDFPGKKNMKIVFSRNDPFVKMPDELLRVAMYAWDGNALPGKQNGKQTIFVNVSQAMSTGWGNCRPPATPRPLAARKSRSCKTRT